jgi:phage shock protein A
VDADADGVDVRRRQSQAPTDARAKLAPMSLLSPPTDEMRAAAHALIHKQDQPPVGDQLLRLAIEQVKSELTEYESMICEGIDNEPAHAQEALELALAQRISSTRLALDGGEDKLANPADEQPVPAPPTSRRASR